MPVVFANPWGLLGLLAVPAVVLIHFLQRRTGVIPVSTLFLIEPRREPARMGRRFDRLISSVPLWLQLLVALLLTALLAQPRLPTAGSVLRVGVVVDSSASMRLCQEPLAQALADFAARQRGAARRLEWLVLPSDPARPRLYAGDDIGEMRAALAAWQPAGGPVDPRAALRLVRERVGAAGVVLYGTDTPREALPADAALLAVGTPVENHGCYGVVVGQRDGKAHWQAVVSNKGTAATEISWHLEWDGTGRGESSRAKLAADGTTVLEGFVPAGAARLELVLEQDAFGLDDRFPFLAPAVKPLYVRNMLGQAGRWLGDKLTRMVPALSTAPAGADGDFALAASTDGKFPTVAGPAILMSAAEDAKAATLAEPVAAIRHPLVDGLYWETLSVRAVPMVPPDPADTVLVWAGKTPLVSLRGTAGAGQRQLVLHFNPNQSNWDRLPAAAVLMLRYCEEIRLAKRGTAREQLEPGQRLANLLPAALKSDLTVETLSADGRVTATRRVPATALAALAAPDEPGFLRVREGEVTLIEGAVAFADAREGDFRACATRVPEGGTAAASRADDALAPWWPVVLLLVLGALLLSWAWAAREAASNAPDDPLHSPPPVR